MASRLGEKPTLPMGGNSDEPAEVTASYPSQIDTKKIKKKIRCLVMDIHKGSMPRLVYKPVNVNYGAKWFPVGGERYWIIYGAIKDFGKFYAYMVQHGNAVGALYYSEHEEYADANQVELMANQHAVEVFKKHKGIPMKLVLILAIAMLVAIVGVMIMVMFYQGVNQQLTNAKAQITSLQATNQGLTEQLNTIRSGQIG